MSSYFVAVWRQIMPLRCHLYVVVESFCRKEMPVALSNLASHVETIVALAEEIAQVAPDCADRALKILEFARELGGQPDRATVEDAIESQLIDS
jgi:hypothetical protein